MLKFWKIVNSFLKKLKLQLPYMIQQLYSWVCIGKKMKTLIQKDTLTLMFITALFITAMSCKQPKCLSTDDWIKKMGGCLCLCECMYNGILLSHKNEILPSAATWMDLENILSEINQTKTRII